MMDFEPSADERASLAKIEKLAYALGLAGLLPFLAGAILVAVFGEGPLGAPAAAAFHYYGVAILSFLGGIRWGYGIRPYAGSSDDSARPYPAALVGSVIPSLIAWGSLFLPTTYGIAILLIAFAAQGTWDSFAAQTGQLPKWFAPLRMLLTVVVVICHAIVFLLLTLNSQ